MASTPSSSIDDASQRRQRMLAELLSRIALGDRAAFATLYQETSAHLMGVILRIQRDRGQAEDVLQEVYVNVWRSAQRFHASLSQPTTWLSSVARNRAIDSVRRRQSDAPVVSRYVGGDGDEEIDLLETLPSDAPGPLDLLERASEERALAECMKRLSGDQQHSLALAYFQGLTHAEVADKLGQPLGTVKSWVRRGLQGLKQCLERAASAPALG
jgi:RNA polymerase sigma-70 factor (ECF subfamily)